MVELGLKPNLCFCFLVCAVISNNESKIIVYGRNVQCPPFLFKKYPTLGRENKVLYLGGYNT
jgi:hypothetical protein